MSRPEYDLMLDKIEHALVTWETIKDNHGLTGEIIDAGRQILQEARRA